MDLRNWFYRQIVTQAQMDEAFDWVEDADHNYIIDSNLSGLIRLNATEWDCQPTTPASMSIEVQGGPHRAYSKAGERIYLGNTTETIDCSVDEYGVSTTVTTVGNSRWISVFVRFKRLAADPEVDGSSVLVYTRQYEDAELFVRQGSEAVAPVKPQLLSDALLVCDIEISYNQTTIQAPNIYIDRTEWWYSKTGMSALSDQLHGNLKVALEDIWNEMDVIAGGGGPFTFTSTWFGGAAVGGGAPATFAQALDAIVTDLAASTGSTRIGTADIATTYVSWTSQSIGGALSALATAVDNHIGGAAPQHPASAITFDDSLGTPDFATFTGQTANDVQEAFQDLIVSLDYAASASDGASRIGTYGQAGVPESFAGNTVRSVLTGLLTNVNARPRKSSDEIIDGSWAFRYGFKAPSAQIGGGDQAHEGKRLCIANWTNTGSRQGAIHPWGGQQASWIGSRHTDPCCVEDPDQSGNYLYVAIEDDGTYFHYMDPNVFNWTSRAITGLSAGVSEISSAVSDGTDLYLCVRRAAANDSIAKITFSTGAVDWEQLSPATDSFRGYPWDRMICGDVLSTSPWTVEIIVLHGYMDPSVSGFIRKVNSVTGGTIWNGQAAALSSKFVGGGLSQNGSYVAFTTDTGDATVAKLGLLNFASGTYSTAIDMAASGTSSADSAYDLTYDGRRFLWNSRGGKIRFYQPALGGRWPALTDNVGFTCDFYGFGICFDGSQTWAVSPLDAPYMINLYSVHGSDNQMQHVREYNNLTHDTVYSWSPLASPWDMGRPIQVGSFMCFACANPTNPVNRNAVAVMRNSNMWY